MTRPSILEKLDRALREDIATECQVVYILAEIRKLIGNDVRRYPALYFYCSFALHTVMDREGARRILKRFDIAYPLLCRDEELPRDLRDEIHQTTKLERFHSQLKAFLTLHALPEDKIFGPHVWPQFVHLYAGVIDECELTVRVDDEPLENIDRVVVSMQEAEGRAEGMPNHFIFCVRWTCHGKDGTQGSDSTYFGFDEPDAVEVAERE